MRPPMILYFLNISNNYHLKNLINGIIIINPINYFYIINDLYYKFTIAKKDTVIKLIQTRIYKEGTASGLDLKLNSLK